MSLSSYYQISLSFRQFIISWIRVFLLLFVYISPNRILLFLPFQLIGHKTIKTKNNISFNKYTKRATKTSHKFTKLHYPLITIK